MYCAAQMWRRSFPVQIQIKKKSSENRFPDQNAKGITFLDTGMKCY